MLHLVTLSCEGAPMASAYWKKLGEMKGLRVTAVLEKNAKLAADIVRIFTERFGAQAPLFEAPSQFGIVEQFISGVNSSEGLATITKLKPDLILLAGAGIVKGPLLAIPPMGAINCHPGILPRYRGCTCVEWALYEDQPVGATCHFVTEEIDAGDIVYKETMPIFAGDTYLQIRLRMFYFQSEVMVRGVSHFLDTSAECVSKIEKFDWNGARYYKTIPADKMEAVRRKLVEGRYARALYKP